MHLSGKPYVLVVDDDPSIGRLLAEFLLARGHEAVTVTNGVDAIRQYRADRPIAVILDMVMPGEMDGLAALAQFKQIDHDVPVIVLSGEERTATAVQAMKLGASDFVSKPFDEAELDGPLADALRQRQPGREISTLRDRLQSKFLEVLQDGELSRLAGQPDVHVDVRIVTGGQLRDDLSFRLSLLNINGARLHQRTDDVPRAAVDSPEGAGRTAMPQALTPTEIVSAAAEAGNCSLKDISRTAAREAERTLIFKTLQQTQWNRKATAEILGISYKALLYKIKDNHFDQAS